MTTITVYTRPGCQPCRAVKRWLTDRGHPFEEVDLSTDLDALRAVKALGYRGAPVTIINTSGADQHFHGFDPGELQRLLGKRQVA